MSEAARLLRRLWQLRDDPQEAVRRGSVKARAYAQYPVRRQLAKRHSFVYREARLTYFAHHYNETWNSERAVEVSIARSFIERWPKSARGLEIGNVLHHYGVSDHVVVDKYEAAPGVLNVDVVDLDLGPLDWIVAVSTLEHVGRDEAQWDDQKVVRAIERLQRQLTPGGALLITAPLGYNVGLDNLVRSGPRTSAETFFRRDASSGNEWRLADREIVLRLPSDSHHRPGRVSTLWVAEFGKL